MLRKPLYSLFLFAILFAGCDKLKPTFKDVEKPYYTAKELEIAESMKDVPLADCEKVYKVQIGFVNYLRNTNKAIKLSDVFGDDGKYEDAVFFKLYTDYKYEPKYKNFSDKVAEYLEEKGYNDFGKIVVEKVADDSKEIAEEKVIEDFTVLTNAIKSAIEKKMAE
jgi:hypothetical protein